MNGGLVSGDGWISDESEFYGSARKKRKLENQASRVNLLQLIRDWQLQLNALAPIPATLSTQDEPPKVEKFHNYFEGAGHMARQLSETIPEFLERLPPRTSEGDGSWIWCSNPIVKSRNEGGKGVDQSNVPAFIDVGSGLMEQFVAERIKVEKGNQGKAASTIIRKLGPWRDKLKEDILASAIKHGVTSGKWMLFPTEEEVNEIWRTVCDSLVAAELGSTAKVAVADLTRNPSRNLAAPKRRLICIYTDDFSDLSDVRRVLDRLVELGLVSRDGSGIWYKCDAYTYLGIESDNPYKLKASLYGSKALLGMSRPSTTGKTGVGTSSSSKDVLGKAMATKQSELEGWLF